MHPWGVRAYRIPTNEMDVANRHRVYPYRAGLIEACTVRFGATRRHLMVTQRGDVIVRACRMSDTDLTPVRFDSITGLCCLHRLHDGVS